MMQTLNGFLDQRMAGAVGLRGLSALERRGGSAFGLSVTPSVSGSRTGAGLCVSGPATITLSGLAPGLAAHVRWQQFSGNPMVVDSPSAFSTTFSADMAESTGRTAVWRARVYDSAGTARWSEPVAVSLVADATLPGIVTTLSPLAMAFDASLAPGSLTVVGGISLTVAPDDHPPFTFLWTGADGYEPGPTAFLPGFIFNAPGSPQTTHHFLQVTITDAIGRYDSSEWLLITINWS